MNDYKELAEAVRADYAHRQDMIRKHGSVDNWMRALRAEERAELERTIAVAAQLEVAGGQHAETWGKMRRSLAAELFVGKIAG